jgi:hypothetical protein
MKSDDERLQIEITISTPGRSRGGPKSRRRASATSRIPRITRLMALAIKFQDMVDRSEVRDYADLARLGYVSRARMTQIMNLLNLAPDIQEQLLSSPTLRWDAGLPERELRHITAVVEWNCQRKLWNALIRQP